MASQKNHGEVLEGFLCPICMEDLASITQLQAHFEEKHETDDKLGVPLFKELINKAKKKLLNDDDELHFGLPRKMHNPFASDANGHFQNDPWHWDLPSFIPSRNHSNAFKRIRSERIDSFVAETNKLLIRLDKLLSHLPSDPTKRKAYEKEIVSWVDNKDVPLCPFCAKAFTIARRRHHCRLCGAVLCDDCSSSLSFSYAEKLVSPVHQGEIAYQASHASDEKTSTGPLGSLLGSIQGLKRSNSHGSLNSILSAVESLGKERSFRVCSHCLSRLTLREKQVEQRAFKPLLSVYYEKLLDHKRSLLQLLPQYLKMAESLAEGETTYHLSDAEELRMKILKLSDSLSLTAQKIRNLGAAGVALEGQEIPVSTDGEKVAPHPRQEILQRRIHSSTVSFLKQEVLALPKLPTPEQLPQRREKKRKETEARIVAEREAERMAEEKAASVLRRKRIDESPRGPNSQSRSLSSSYNSLPNHSTFNPKKKQNEVIYDNGWGADTSAHRVTETDDPIVQQMNVIRNYIRQAREASKYDEVFILEENLKELQLEFKKREWSVDP